MHPVLFNLPAALLLLVGGAIGGTFLAQDKEDDKKRKTALPWVGAILGAIVALSVGAWRGWLTEWVPLRGYGAMVTTGFLLAVWMARRRSPELGVAATHCLDVGLWGLVGGLIGARSYYVYQNWPEFSPFGEAGAGALLNVFKLWEGGLVFYGAFIPAIVIAAVYCRIHRIPMIPFLDLAAPSLIIGQSLGRLGCFLFGCCYGKPCELPWAVHFPEPSPAYGYAHDLATKVNGVVTAPGLHPIQLYSFLGALLIALFLYSYWPRRRFDGQLLGMMILMVAVNRFLEEYLRGDGLPPGIPVLESLAPSLSDTQWLALGMLIFAGGWLLYFGKRNRLYVPQPSQPESSDNPTGSASKTKG